MPEFDLFADLPSGVDTWRRAYWEQKNKNPDQVTKWLKQSNQATVEVVLKKDKPDQDKVKDFYEAQRELAKNTLPDQCKSATVELSEMQLRNESEFSDQAFKPSTLAARPFHGKTTYAKCGHISTCRCSGPHDTPRTLDEFCPNCKYEGKAAELNPKEPYRNFKEKSDEMKTCPSAAFDVVYPMPFGCTNPPHPATQPTSSLPNGTLASNPTKDTFHEMQKDNTIEYIGDKYLPKSAQDGKHDPYLPPQYQLSSANQNAELGCLMAMIPSSYASEFTNFAKQNINPDSLHTKGLEEEPHITACYGFDDKFDSSRLEKMLGGTGPIRFTVGEVGRFEHPDYDVLHLKVHSPELEMVNAKISREFAGHLDNPNQRYNPHLTLGYVKRGTNKHLDGKIFKQKQFSVSKLLYSGPHKTKRHIVSLAWDATKFDDGGFEDSFQSQDKRPQDEKPLNSVGDALQAFLIKRASDKKKENEDLYAQLDKPFGHEKQV